MARRGTFLASAIVVLAALAVYYNSFSTPFILDDQSAILDNPTIRQLGSALSPPPDATVGSRPILNLTFALNYALGGMNAWGYHAFNLLIHALAGLTLFGIVRRTLECGRGEGTPPTVSARDLATILALAVAVLWVVHPLQTEAVTYISQRAESLMGLFYLLTVYCFIRSQDSGARSQEKRSGFRPLASSLPVLRSPELAERGEGGWLVASILACLLGALSKEVIVTAPVIALLYDRTFIAGSFREAWRLRWPYYLGLASTWLLLACLMTGLHQRGVGFDQGVPWWNYALTSCRSVVLYLKLAVWPHPLVFDYGTKVVHRASEVVPYALILVGLLAGMVIALRRRPIIGFAGACFFTILAPTSSIVPVAGQPMAEHREYLPLAAVIGLAVLGLHTWIGRRSLAAFAVAAVGLGCLSARRNEDYRNELTIWNDTTAKQPDNARAHLNLGNSLAHIPGRLLDEIAEYKAALHLQPDYAEAHNDLGVALAQIPGRLPEAMAEYRTALHLKPDYADAHNNLGDALLLVPGHLPDATAEYRAALRIKPDYAEAHLNLGFALSQAPGHVPEVMAEYQAALRIKPDYAEAHYDLGNTLSQIPSRASDAIVEYESALRINPNYAEAHYNLGRVLSRIPGRVPDAIVHFEAALQLRPDVKEVREALDQLRAKE